nr:unnamed protein product [Spirometra erinaceieuropaei]
MSDLVSGYCVLKRPPPPCVCARFETDLLYPPTSSYPLSPSSLKLLCQNLELVEHSRLKKLSKRLSQALSLLNLVDGGIVLDPSLLPPRRPPPAGLTLPRGLPTLSIEEARSAGRLRDQLTQLATTVHATWLRQLELREILKGRVAQRALPVSKVMPPGERSASCSLFDGHVAEDTGRTKGSQSPCPQLAPTSEPPPPVTTTALSVGAGLCRRRSSDKVGGGAFESGFVSDSENVTAARTSVWTAGRRCGSAVGRTRTRSFPPTEFISAHHITASVAKSRCTAANSSERTLECARLVGSTCSRTNDGADVLSQVSASCSARFPPSQLLIHPPLQRQICTGNANNSINATTSVNLSLDRSPPPQSPVRSGSQELGLEGHLDQSLPPPQFTSSPAKNSASEALSLILDEVGSRGGVADRRQVVSTSPPFSVKYAWETTFSLLSQEVEEDEEEEDSAVVSPGVLSQPSTSSQLFGHAGGVSGSFLSKKHRRMSKSLPNFSGRENASISSGSPGFLGSPLKDPSNPSKPIISTELNAIMPELYSAFRPLNTSSSACDCFSDGDEDELSDLSSDNSRSANLSELAAVLRLPPTATKVIQEIFREGTEVHQWLSKLEDSLYQSLPPVTCSEQAFSRAYCRVQHDIPRRELDKCLSELEFYRQQLEGWREDLNNLMTSQRERFEKLSRDNQKISSLLLSGPSSLNFVSDWLDMLILRCVQPLPLFYFALCRDHELFIDAQHHQSQPTCLEHDMDVYRKRVEAFGWHAIVVDGHDVSALLKAFSEARAVSGKPVALLARTFKGYDFPGISDKENWHGKPLGSCSAEVLAHLEKKLKSPSTLHKLRPKEPAIDCQETHLIGSTKLPNPPPYKKGDKIATREAYGRALQRLGEANPRVIGLDGDTKNSTFSIYLRDSRPQQFIECFIAEQNLVGVAIGCAVRERTVPFVSTFAAFLTRAFDQIRMGAISQTDCNFCGSHAGVSIGEDGPSQMALEDLAMFRAVRGSTVFYPSDAVACERAVELAANRKGICFIRTGRPATPVIYDENEQFKIGQAKLCLTALTKGGEDHVTVVAAGVTLYEAFKAAEKLAKEGINLRIIDPFTIKPLDSDLITKSVAYTQGRVITVEDHAPEGGIGEAVAAALGEAGVSCNLRMLAIHEVPRSGKCAELLALYRIDADAIVDEARALCKA